MSVGKHRSKGIEFLKSTSIGIVLLECIEIYTVVVYQMMIYLVGKNRKILRKLPHNLMIYTIFISSSYVTRTIFSNSDDYTSDQRLSTNVSVL